MASKINDEIIKKNKSEGTPVEVGVEDEKIEEAPLNG